MNSRDYIFDRLDTAIKLRRIPRQWVPYAYEIITKKQYNKATRILNISCEIETLVSTFIEQTSTNEFVDYFDFVCSETESFIEIFAEICEYPLEDMHDIKRCIISIDEIFDQYKYIRKRQRTF